MSRIEGGNNKGHEVEVELRFNSELNTLNMALTTEHETIDYHNIRLPEELRGLVPLRSTVRPHEQIIKSVVGKEEIEIFVEGSKVTMKPASSWTESRREY